MSGCSGDSSDPESGSNPTSDTGAASTNCTQCTITSQTTASVPPDRTRTMVGVGEEVTLTVDPAPATWSVSGAGTVSPSSGASVTFRAGERAGSATVTAEGAGCCCSITFTVVEPSGIMMSRTSLVRHRKGKPDCGFLARPYVLPNSVSFQNIEVREKNSKATATGYFLLFNGTRHQPEPQNESDWFTAQECCEGLGSPADCHDEIYSGYPGVPTPSVGLMTFPITWEFRVAGGGEKAMPDFEQRHAVTSAGVCTTSKGGASETTNLNDEDSGY
jgi:hypothetical protein